MIDTIYSNPKAIKHDDLAKMISNELMHYGVKGMHWGVRRYQPYPDGTSRITKAVLGEKGQYPLAASAYQPNSKGVSAVNNAKSAIKNNAGKAFEPSIKKGKGKENVSPVSEIGRSIKDSANAGSDIANRIDQIQKRNQGDTYDYSQIHQMSDAELRNRINRIQMERQYASLTQKQTVSGAQKAKEVLDTVGDVATVVIAVGTAVSVLSKIKKV